MSDDNPNARTNHEAWSVDDLARFIHKDISAMKVAFDEVLRPYKNDVRCLRAENVSLRNGIDRLGADMAKVMQLIAERHPEEFDDALALLLDNTRGGWVKFRQNWRRRVGLTGGRRRS